jgi:hypothetical protein
MKFWRNLSIELGLKNWGIYDPGGHKKSESVKNYLR